MSESLIDLIKITLTSKNVFYFKWNIYNFQRGFEPWVQKKLILILKQKCHKINLDIGEVNHLL